MTYRVFTKGSLRANMHAARILTLRRFHSIIAAASGPLPT